MNSFEKLSQDLLWAVKTEGEIEKFEKRYSDIELMEFKSQIQNDTLRKTFWINTYNAWYQIIRRKIDAPSKKIYALKLIPFGRLMLSLDDCEHVILRKNKIKWSLGYLRNIFSNLKVKQFMVDELDYRIHFALNCGATSCPPIRFYESKYLEDQLTMATQAFVEGETTVDHEQKKLTVSRLFLWFMNDFGGKKQIKRLHSDIFKKDFGLYQLDYANYDWSDELANFSESSN